MLKSAMIVGWRTITTRRRRSAG